jgi:hypothetical protein
MSTENKKPLTLTLSPSDGERERWSASRENPNGIRFANKLKRILPLPFGRGEGRGEGPSVVAYPML